MSFNKYNTTKHQKNEKKYIIGEAKKTKTIQLYTVYKVCFEIYKYCTSSFFRGRIYIQINDIKQWSTIHLIKQLITLII